MPITLTPELSTDFTLTNNTLVSKDGETEIGDAEQAEFYPHIKLKRWLNEANISARLVLPNYTADDIRTEGGKAIFQKGVLTVRMYRIPPDAQNEQGGLELDILLSAKPVRNYLDFSIQSKGIKAHYQGALTAQEIADGNERPVNVVGSYAIYHATKAHGKYKTGKLLHIYRPYAEDALGTRIWCKVDIAAGNMRITVPQAFLDSATYPVLVDPTFGYNTAGGSSAAFSNTAVCRANINDTYAASTGDEITKYTAYTRTYTTGGFDIVAYSMSGGSPDSRLGTPATITSPASPAWTDSGAVTHSMVNGTTYCVAFGDVTDAPRIYYDTLTDSESRDDGTTLDATWAEATKNTQRYSLYATYTVSGAGATGKSNPLYGPLGGPLVGPIG